MGFKLQDKIQQMRGIPGKYKRVLTAIAQRARNDGTNFYESKDTIAAKAGVNRATVYRNIDRMVDLKVLLEAASHECSNKDCPKGSKHFFMAGNHWTEAFDLNLDAIFDLETWSRDKMQHESENSRVAKRRKCRVAKSTKCDVAKCDAIQGVNPNHVSLGVDESSALTSGSEKASKQVALATLASPAPSLASLENQNLPESGFLESEDPNQSQKQNQEQPQPQTLQELVDSDNYTSSPDVELLYKINPNVTDAMVREQLPLCAEILTYFDNVPNEYRVLAAEMVLEWNRAHRSGKYATKEDRNMVIRTAERFLKALKSGNAILMGDYDLHEFDRCETCKEKGLVHYKTLIKEILADRERAKEQRKREAAEAAEKARLAKLCPICKERKPGKMAIGGFQDLGNGHSLQTVAKRVCDECYDQRYETQVRMGTPVREVLQPRPGYAEAKAERDRIANLCPKCKENPRAKNMLFLADQGSRTGHTWKNVCDPCYDAAYELEQEQWKSGKIKPTRLLTPRKEYVEAKALQKAMEDAEVDVPICQECGQVSFHAKSCSKNPNKHYEQIAANQAKAAAAPQQEEA